MHTIDSKTLCFLYLLYKLDLANTVQVMYTLDVTPVYVLGGFSADEIVRDYRYVVETT